MLSYLGDCFGDYLLMHCISILFRIQTFDLDWDALVQLAACI
jgi:hypothetical protein